MKKSLIVILAVLFIGMALYTNITFPGRHGTISLKEFTQIFSGQNNDIVKIKNQEIFVETVKTPEAMQKGLGGHKPLKDNEGMLFVFPEKSTPSIWMKDMTFPIDIVWIKDNKILYLVQNAPIPKSGQTLRELPVYSPPGYANYVLEVKAGTVQRYGFWVGEKVILNF